MEDPNALGGFPTLHQRNGSNKGKDATRASSATKKASKTKSAKRSPSSSSNTTKPFLYKAPTRGDEDSSNANTLIVDHRAQKAEQLITKVFGYVRNCHYGMFSTWSNGDVWKFADLSDDVPLMTALDAHNAKHGHKTNHARQQQRKGRSSSAGKKGLTDQHHHLKVLNKSGSNPHADGAYSGIHLDLHTDNTYYVDVPRLQAFGCIFTHSTKTIGGETSLVDGARVAIEAARLCHEGAVPTVATRKLTEKFSLAQRRRFLELLCTVPIAGRFEKEQHYYNGLKPIVNLTKGATASTLLELCQEVPFSTKVDGSPNEAYIQWCRKLQHALGGTSRPLFDTISFNNSDRAPLHPLASKAFASASARPNSDANTTASAVVDLVDPARIQEFYQAYEWFHSLVHDPELAIHFSLKPGQILFFDNHRVLHGRLEFGGPRVMCGSYVGSDEYYSTLKAACACVNNNHQQL